MYNFKHLYGPEHFISAPNSSNKFWAVLFGYMEKYHKTGDSLLLVAEPKECIPLFYKFNLSFIDNIVNVLKQNGENRDTKVHLLHFRD